MQQIVLHHSTGSFNLPFVFNISGADVCNARKGQENDLLNIYGGFIFSPCHKSERCFIEG